MSLFERALPMLHPAAAPLSGVALLITPTRNPWPSVAAELLVTTQ